MTERNFHEEIAFRLSFFRESIDLIRFLNPNDPTLPQLELKYEEFKRNAEILLRQQ